MADPAGPTSRLGQAIRVLVVLPTVSPATEPDLRHYLQVVKRRKTIVVACVTVVVGTAVFLSFLRTPNYAATAKLLLRPRTTQSVFNSDSQRTDAARLIQTEIEVISTDPVKEIVTAKIGGAPPVQVRPVGQTDLVSVRAESTDPTRAALVANAYASAYIEFRRQQALEDLAAGSAGVQEKIADLQRQVDELASQLDAAPVCIDARTTTAACNQRINIEQSVGQRRATLLNQQAVFRSKLDQLQVDAALANGGAEVLTPAFAPNDPFEPKPLRNGVLAFVLGLMLGISGAFLIEYLDDSIKRKEDLERAVPGISVLGLVPLVAGWKARDEGLVISSRDPGSAAAEAYRILRTSIQFLDLDTRVRVIQVTSPSAQEGKTTTLANLAVAFASAGLRTIMVDCDLRRPRLHDFFELDHKVGFTSVLLGRAGLVRALQPVPGYDRLLLLASGPLPPNPSELLSSRRAADVIQNLGAQADIVLIDSPPSLPVTDALVLSQRVDSTLLITTARVTSRRDAARAVEMLQQVGAPLTGLILNGVMAQDGYGGYNAGYQYEPRSTADDGTSAAAPHHRSRRARRRRARSGA